MVRVEVFRGVDGLEQVKTDWHTLLTQHLRPRFHHFFGWWRAYLTALEPTPDSVRFIVFRDQDGPLAIVPIKHHVWRLLGLHVRELGFPNHPHMPLQDALYRPGTDALALIVQWLERSGEETGLPWDLVRFNGVMSESPLASANASAFEKRKGQACAYFDCARPYEEILHSFSKNLQSNLRKARNKWAKESGTCFLAVTEPAQMEARFLDFLRVESSGWKGASGSGTAVALHPGVKRFYERLIHELSPLGNVRLHCLKLRGEVIAANFCVSDDDTLYILKIGYDEKWSHFSPGSILCEYVLKESAANPRIRYVNLVTDMEWHQAWHPSFYEVYNLALFNSTPVGRFCRVGMHAKQRLKKLLHRSTDPGYQEHDQNAYRAAQDRIKKRNRT